MRGYIRLSEFLRSELLDIKNEPRILSMIKTCIRKLTRINDSLLTSYESITEIEEFRRGVIPNMINECVEKVKNGINYKHSSNYFLKFSTKFQHELEKIKQQNYTIVESIGRIVTSLTKI